MPRVAIFLLVLTTFTAAMTCEAQRVRRAGAASDRKTLQVSALIINGLVDESVPHAGGAPRGRFTEAWDGTPTEPAAEQGKFWAAADGCERTAPNVDRGRYLVVPFRCPGSLAVESYTVKDGAHAWPGGRKGSRMGATPSTAIDATDVVWKFFAQHTKQ